MIEVGLIHVAARRIAILLARKAQWVDGILVWTMPSGVVLCAHARSEEASRVLRDSPAFVVGTYGPGARASDIFDDLGARRRELDSPEEIATAIAARRYA